MTAYGLYLYNEGQAEIWPCPRANGDYTVEVLERLRRRYPAETVKLLWDGAPYHRARQEPRRGQTTHPKVDGV